MNQNLSQREKENLMKGFIFLLTYTLMVFASFLMKLSFFVQDLPLKEVITVRKNL